MDLWFDIRRARSGDRQSSLVIDFSSAQPKICHPSLAARESIKAITYNHPGPYTLLASGGIDSQAMIYFWHASGVKFEVVHYDYGTNCEDTATLVQFCNRLGLDFKIKKFNVESFLASSEYLHLAKKYDCVSPHILTYIKFTSLHNETCVMGGNYISNNNTPINWTILGLDRFRQIDKHNFVPFFLMSSPDLAYSFLQKEIDLQREYGTSVQLAKTDEVIYELKAKCYEWCGIPVLRQSKKLTGFEEIKNSYDSIRIDARTRLKWAHMPSKRPFDLIYRYEPQDLLPLGKYSDSVHTVHNPVINNASYYGKGIS